MSEAGAPTPALTPQAGEGDGESRRDAALSRLRWQCQRGMLELDHILRGFLDDGYAKAPAEVQAAFEALLTLDDADMLDLFLAAQAPADAAQASLLALLRRSP